jgi:hypothetical protein
MLKQLYWPSTSGKQRTRSSKQGYRGHRGQSGTGQINAGDELDHFSRPATRRARSGLPWLPKCSERR